MKKVSLLFFYNGEDSLYQVVHLQRADGGQRSKTSFFSPLLPLSMILSKKVRTKYGNIINRQSVLS